MSVSVLIGKTVIQYGLVSASSLLTPSGFVFPDSAKQSIVPVEEPIEFPALQDIHLSKGAIVAPALWGQQLVGFDLAQQEFSHQELSPVTVYVADAGVARGSHRKIELRGPAYQRRKIKLRLVAKSSNPQIQKLLNGFSIPILGSIPDPTDVVPDHHPTHGTHVAGLIGSGLNDVGAGVSNTIVDLDIFKGVGRYRFENLIEGLEQIERENLPNSILNLSVETSIQREIADGLKRLNQNTDTLIVLASGNSGMELTNESVPALVEEGITVGAIGLSGVRASFSNYGDAIDLVAPGEQILSRGDGFQWKPESLEVMSGTSFSAPIVSGSASVVRSILPQASREVVKTILFKTALDLGLKGKDSEYGHGLVNTYRAALVAQRLRTMNLKSNDELIKAMEDSKIWDVSEELRAAMIEQEKVGFGTNQFEALLRKTALLDVSTEKLERLGLYHMVQGAPLFGMGLVLAHFNQQDTTPTCEDLEAAVQIVWALQKVRAVSFRDLSVIRGLTNKELLFATYSAMDAELMPLTPLFEERLKKIAPDQELAFRTLVAQKTESFLKIDQAVVVNTAK